MFDCHSHSLLSDGELGPVELARRAEVKGLEGLAITDHVDSVTVRDVVTSLVERIGTVRDHMEIDLLAGCEITHTPPSLIADVAEEASRLGAEIILVHGETLVEPVKAGTNLAAVQTPDVDVLAHPGLIDDRTVELAVNNGIALEISARKGHSLANGHLVRVTRETEAQLMINTDSHAPADLIAAKQARDVIRGAGHPDPDRVMANNERIFLECRERA